MELLAPIVSVAAEALNVAGFILNGQKRYTKTSYRFNPFEGFVLKSGRNMLDLRVDVFDKVSAHGSCLLYVRS